jgi:hypothetical protein
MTQTQFNRPVVQNKNNYVKPFNQRPEAAKAKSKPAFSPSEPVREPSKGKSKLTPKILEAIEIRNQEIIKYILEMKFMTIPQLIKSFFMFAEASKQELYAKSAIKKLSGLEYIRAIEHTATEQTLLVATAKGQEYLQKFAEGKKVAAPIAKVWDPVVRHDLMLVDIRQRFEELGYITKWYSEQQLISLPQFASLMKDLPDAIVMDTEGRGYFLELEISRKGNQRYVDRVAEYKKLISSEQMKKEKISGVMFLCTDEKVYDLIKGIVAKENLDILVHLVSSYLTVEGE